jgi:hypothetical protein
MPPGANPRAPNTDEDVASSVAPRLGDECYVDRSFGYDLNAASWFGRCVLCGLIAWKLRADHGCVPTLLPEEVVRVMWSRWTVAYHPAPARSFYDDFFPPTPSRPPRPVGGLVSRVTVNARLNGILGKLRSTPEGTRNPTLHWVACRVGEMLVDGHLPDARLAVDELTTVALEIGLTPQETAKTIRSGFSTSGVIL